MLSKGLNTQEISRDSTDVQNLIHLYFTIVRHVHSTNSYNWETLTIGSENKAVSFLKATLKHTRVTSDATRGSQVDYPPFIILSFLIEIKHIESHIE